MLDLTKASIAELRAGLKKRQHSAVDIIEAYSASIAATDSKVKAFLHLDIDGARIAAQALDDQMANGEDVPPLAGVVVAVKDNICVSGMPATAASKILEGYQPPYSATVIERLVRAGAIILGKTNLDEFAMGVSTETSAFHPTNNPLDTSRVPGGSSGGSAAAVAAGFATVALGSDTGGSVRQPASFTGIVGMRPTYGSVSRYGLMAMASSMDVIGPLARNVSDARELLAAIAGYDPYDATSLPHSNVMAMSTSVDMSKIRFGVPREYLEGDVKQSVSQAIKKVLSLIEHSGGQIIDISLPSTKYVVPTYYVITPAEASSNLARYDGIRFGPGIANHLGHGQATAALRGERFGTEPLRRTLLGAFVLSSGYHDQYYQAAQRARTMIRQDFSDAFEKVDVLVTPTSPTEAFRPGELTNPVDLYLQDIFTDGASLAGLPALSMPAPVEGLPIGVQLIARQRDDGRLLDVAHEVEKIIKS